MGSVLLRQPTSIINHGRIQEVATFTPRCNNRTLAIFTPMVTYSISPAHAHGQCFALVSYLTTVQFVKPSYTGWGRNKLMLFPTQHPIFTPSPDNIWHTYYEATATLPHQNCLYFASNIIFCHFQVVNMDLDQSRTPHLTPCHICKNSPHSLCYRCFLLCHPSLLFSVYG